ncbi:MAG: hypothetical protein WCP69_09550 [Bacteroidota bacterium]
MNIKFRDIGIDSQAIVPTLKIGINIDFCNLIEVPIFISGRLISSDNKVVSHLNEYQLNTDYKYELKILSKKERDNLQRENNNEKYYAQLTALLSQKSIDYIEALREKDKDKSVSFTLDLIVKYLELPISQHSVMDEPLIRVNSKKFYDSLIINQSDWINSFSPFLGIGKFILIELEIPEKQKVNDEWIEMYDRLFLRLNEIQDLIRQGNWKGTMISGRQFYESLKFSKNNSNKGIELRESLKQLFLDDMHSEEGFEDFYLGIKSFFNFVSKFIHDKSNKTGAYIPVPNPSKEDAYFVYALAIGLINIISKKIAKTR